jgi:hypothetical protein
MNWKIKALLQIFLSKSKIGDKLNHIPATLKKNYHYYVFWYQTSECIRKFKESNVLLKKEINSNALEIGTGYSIISPIVLFLLGFKSIITVDITEDISFKTFKKQRKFLETEQFLETIIAESIFDKEEIKNKIILINQAENFETLFKLANITYIAPYKFEDIEKLSTSFTYISSQVVLEHVYPKIINEIFEKTKKWLQTDGVCVHTINFIDHFANPGIFQDKNISEFNFLKYSDKFWEFWAGNSIAYTNRLSYIYYLEMAKKYNLEIVDFKGENYRIRKELDPKLIHQDVINKYKSIHLEELTRYQRGTLILKK